MSSEVKLSRDLICHLHVLCYSLSPPCHCCFATVAGLGSILPCSWQQNSIPAWGQTRDCLAWFVCSNKVKLGNVSFPEKHFYMGDELHSMTWNCLMQCFVCQTAALVKQNSDCGALQNLKERQSIDHHTLATGHFGDNTKLHDCKVQTHNKARYGAFAFGGGASFSPKYIHCHGEKRSTGQPVNKSENKPYRNNPTNESSMQRGLSREVSEGEKKRGNSRGRVSTIQVQGLTCP